MPKRPATEAKRTKGSAAAAALAALLFAAGCTTTGLGGAPQQRAPAGGSPIMNPDGTGELEVEAEMPPDMMRLPSLPVPPGAEVLLGDTVIIGDDDAWTGQVVMTTGSYSLVQVVEFMRRQMPNYGWRETAVVRSKRTSLTYVLDQRFATVRIMPVQGGAEIDIVVAPFSRQTGAPSPTG